MARYAIHLSRELLSLRIAFIAALTYLSLVGVPAVRYLSHIVVKARFRNI
jgi:hypothetical protein